MLLDIYSGNDLRQDDDLGAGGVTIFNDLTYSDDEEGLEWRETENSFAADSHTSSPDTAALLDEIQKAMLPAQETGHFNDDDHDADDKIGQQEQLHLIHPLAHYDSFRTSEGDEGSQLEYSITSSVMSPPITNYGSLESVTPYFDYNNINNNVAKSAAVIFRSPPNVFHSTGSNDSPPPIVNSASSYTMPPYLKPKLPHRVEKVAAPAPSTTIHRRQQAKYNKVETNHNIQKFHHLVTPLPSITNVSPATSATATDTTESPNDVVITAPHPPPRPLPPAERLSHDATKRQRKHRRLRRIKKAAEAREAMVQKVRGVEQHSPSSSSCRDSVFAYAFLCQFLLVSISAFAFGSEALWDMIRSSLSIDHVSGEENDGEGVSSTTTIVDRNPFAGLETDDVIITDGQMGAGGRKAGGAGSGENINITDGISDIDFINVIQLVCIASGYACLCSLLSLGFMMMLSKNTLHVMLMLTIAVCLVWSILGLIFSPYWITPLVGALGSALSILYTLVVWDRIAFAATNLSVALKGMRSTFYIPCVGFFILAITFIWTVWWIFALIGTLNFLSDDEEISDDLIYVVVAFFAFSYYWTFQVIKGASQTTIAIIIGKWWGVSEDEPLSMYSADLRITIKNRLMGSIGSICLGSLIVDPCISLSRITTFSLLVRPKIPCLHNCNTNRAENAFSLPEYESVISRTVNQWSFTYIGLYGYGFWDSGSKASQLFQARGWTNIVSDDLVMTVMGMSSMIIGGSTALLGLIVEEVDGYYFTSSIQKPIAITFLICLFVGYILSNAFLSIVEGCISAILVCYAASPVEFHANHHKLCEEMKSVWKQFWLQKPQ